MATLHVLVPAVFVLVGQSTACVEWTIANPPIIFGKTAHLLCAHINSSSNTHNITSWLGGKDYAVLTYNGGSVHPRKYAEIRRCQRGKFESILQIYKFDEMDVNVNYSCSIGGCQNRKRLSLTPDKFQYHPDKDTTRVVASLRNGHLDIIMRIMKVYPIPNCTIMFNENIISRGLTTKTSVNGIFYMYVEEVDQLFFYVCSNQLSVTCVVGKTEIPIHQETFNRCTKTIKEESSEYINNLEIVIVALVLVCAFLVIGMGCLVKYGQLRNALCCRQLWRGDDEGILMTNIKEMVNLYMAKNHDQSIHIAEQTESQETRAMIHH